MPSTRMTTVQQRQEMARQEATGEPHLAALGDDDDGAGKPQHDADDVVEP